MVSLPIRNEGQALVRIRPTTHGLLTSSCHLLRRLCPALCPGYHADHGTTKYPESLCLISALPLSGRRESPPARTLLPGHGSYGLMRQSHPARLGFSLSLARGVSAGCYQPLLPAGPSRRYLCESFSRCLDPYPGGTWSAFACFFLHVIGLPPYTIEVGYFSFPRNFPSITISDGSQFRDCSHFFMFRPLSLLASQIVPTAATNRRRAAEAFTSEQNLLRFLRRHRTC